MIHESNTWGTSIHQQASFSAIHLHPHAVHECFLAIHCLLVIAVHLLVSYWHRVYSVAGNSVGGTWENKHRAIAIIVFIKKCVMIHLPNNAIHISIWFETCGSMPDYVFNSLRTCMQYILTHYVITKVNVIWIFYVRMNCVIGKNKSKSKIDKIWYTCIHSFTVKIISIKLELKRLTM